MNLLQTDRTYASYDNAMTMLVKTLKNAGLTLDDVRYLIAVNERGRFAPVLLASTKLPLPLLIQFAHVGITVVN